MALRVESSPFSDEGLKRTRTPGAQQRQQVRDGNNAVTVEVGRSARIQAPDRQQQEQVRHGDAAVAGDVPGADVLRAQDLANLDPVDAGLDHRGTAQIGCREAEPELAGVGDAGDVRDKELLEYPAAVNPLAGGSDGLEVDPVRSAVIGDVDDEGVF